MKIDIYDIYSEMNDIRVYLDRKFITRLRNSILKKYKSLLNFAKIANISLDKENYQTQLSNWLRENKKYRTTFPLKKLMKITKILKISKEELYRNILSFKIWNGKELKIKRYFNIDENFIYGLGLYIAEGKNSLSTIRRVSLSNNEKEILNFFIRWLKKYFNIKKDQLKFNISTPPHRMKEKTKIINNTARYFSVSPKNIKCYKRKGQTTPTPTIEIFYDSKTLRKLIEWSKVNILEEIYYNKNLSISFLQGVFDGEAHIRKNKAEVIIEMRNQKILNFCELLLRKNKIIPNRNKDVLVIQARDFDKISFFRFQNKRKTIFENHKKNIKHIQVPRNHSIINVLSKFKTNKPINTNKLTNLCNYKKSTITSKICNNAEKCGYLEIDKSNNLYTYRITKKGFKYLKSIKDSGINRINQLKQNIGLM